MPFIEQIIFGINQDEPHKGNHVLAHSPGVAKAAAREISKLCEGWGPVPVLGLSYPALMSFPLEANMASLRGNLYTVIRVSAGNVPRFHALIINDADYTTYGHNPYALAAAFPFKKIWEPGKSVARIKLKAGGGSLVINPMPSPEDVGVVDLVVEQALVRGEVILPLEEASGKSDRLLALVLAAMPKSFLRNLRFGSFAVGQYNNFTLVGLFTIGSPFSGWKRILLAEILGESTSDNDKYVRKVRSLLEIGDLDGLRALDMHARSKRLPAIVNPDLSKPSFVTPGPGEIVQTSQPVAKVDKGNVRRPARTKSHRAAHRKRGDLNITRFLMLILGVVLVGAGGILWMQQYEYPGLDGWPELPLMSKSEKDETQSQSLGKVIDAGKVYDGLVHKLAKATLGQMFAPSKDRFKALAHLQSAAADPLNQQAQEFLKVSSQGILPNGDQVQETARMNKLAARGAALEIELKRLELAWISLSSGLDWRDLGGLSGRLVSARRDSLRRKNVHSLKTASRELGVVGLVASVASARSEVDGMADLLTLYSADAWTLQWQEALPRAVRKIPSSAGRTTRIYRNSARNLGHLKEAERATFTNGLAFSEAFGTEAWFPYEVVELLPPLQKQVGRFSRGEVPAILVSTLSMYEVLQKSAKGGCPGCNESAELESLMANEALRFDPAVYGDLVDRIRFEAVRSKLEQGANPNDLPDVYFYEGDRQATVTFIASLNKSRSVDFWNNMADSANRPFFRRWAEAKSVQVAENQSDLRSSFDGHWEQLKNLRDNVAQLANSGSDWTASWHDLHDEVTVMQEKYPSAWAIENENVKVKIQALDSLARRLDYSGQVDITGAVIRLGEDFDSADKEVIVQLSKSDGRPVGAPQILKLGPAAPAGSGWVGVAVFNWQFTLARGETLVASVKDAVSGKTIQEVTYESLGQRVGCAALSRTKNVGDVSLSFKVAPGYWHGLVLPDLP